MNEARKKAADEMADALRVLGVSTEVLQELLPRVQAVSEGAGLQLARATNHLRESVEDLDLALMVLRPQFETASKPAAEKFNQTFWGLNFLRKAAM